MEKEIKKIALELAKLVKNNGLDYFTITYIDGVVLGNSDPDKENRISIYMDKEEVEKCRCE